MVDAHSGELPGPHMIGSEVTEQIQGFGLAQSVEATDADLAHAAFAHSTLSEALLNTLGMALHK